MNYQSPYRKRLTGVFLLASAVALPALADYKGTVLSQGPVGYWRLNETTAPTPPPIIANNLGSVGGAGNGIYTNTCFPGALPGAIAADTLNGAALFPGVQDGNRVRIPWQPQWNQTGPFSVEFWAKPAQNAALECPAASVEFIPTPTQRNGWLIYQGDSSLNTGNGFVFRQYNSTGLANQTGVAANIAIDTTHWYHVVATFDGTNLRLYVDGNLAAGPTAIAGTPRPNSNSAIPLTFGSRADGVSGFFAYSGLIDEAAMYDTALSASQVLTHYQAGTNAAVNNYKSTIIADNPAGYWRFSESGQPSAANLGTLGAAANGFYVYNAMPNQAGPDPSSSPTPFPGFESGNKACGFDGLSGSVTIPSLKLNTNRITITCWLNPNGSQNAVAGIFNNQGITTSAGLQFSLGGGLMLGYNWNNTGIGSASFLNVNGSQWNFASMMVEPDKVVLFVPGNPPWTNFSANAPVVFDGLTFIGGLPTTNIFNGLIDEVALFNRALSLGEAYDQYADAVGGLAPQDFQDPAAPADGVYTGDTLSLTVDAGGSSPLSYQWRKDSSPISGATSSTFSKPNMSSADNGTYDVVITNPYGTINSLGVPVTVAPATPPVVSSGFIGRTLYKGGTLNLNVVASGGGLQYQWKRYGTNLPGATTSAYVVGSVTTSDAGPYSLSVTNSRGATNIGPATITIPNPANGTYEALVIASTPEAWWRLDESPGSTYLFDGMGRHDGYYTNINGSGSGPTLGVPGISTNGDTAASFNAGGGVGYVPYSVDLNSSIGYTYEAWVKTTALGAYQVPFSSADANGGIWWAMVTGTTPVTWEPGGAGGYYDLWNANNPTPHSFTTLPVASGVWTHLVMVYDPTVVISGTHYPWKFYVNGATDANFVWSLGNNIINASGPFVIGCAANPAALAGSFFNGQVDEIAVYKRAMGLTEVSNHFAAGFPATPPSFSTPFLPQTVTVGKSVSFSTAVQGSTPITLQWYKGSTPISGQTSNTFAIASTAVSDTATYTLWATNSAGVASQSVSLTVIPQTAYANVTNNLVLHLRFDGNTTDTSGHGNNGTAVGGPTFVAGIIGSQALNYSTTTVTNNTPVSNVTAIAESYVTLGTPADLQFGTTTSWSVSLWVKLPAGYSSGDLPFIGTGVGSMNNPGWDLGPTYGGGGWQWCLNDGVAVQAATNNIDVNGASGSINDGNWHNFVLVVDRSANVANTYLDGVFVGGGGISALLSVDNGEPVVIGQDPTFTYPDIPSGASQNDLNVWGISPSATLDDIGVWRRALTALEVAQIQSAGATAGHSFDTVAPPGVTLTITRSGSNLILSWPSGTLLQSDTVGATASWTPVPGASAPSYTFAPSSARKFYRVLVQ
jgi:hypothetical protein